MKKLVIMRRTSQGIFFALFIYILWSTTYPLTGALRPDLFFKSDPLLIIITSISERIILPGITVVAAMLCITLVLGRFFCGWICPLGASIDLAGSLKRKKPNLKESINLIIRKPKYFLLAVIIISGIAGRQTAWIFDPMVIAARFVSLNLIPATTAAMNSAFIFLLRDLRLEGVRDLYHALKPTILGVKIHYFPHTLLILAYFLIVVLAGIFVSRFWCRVICPLGAIYALTARHAILSRAVDKCIKCSRCKTDCRMGAIREDFSYAKGECILCMDCVYNCPPRGTSFRFAASPKQAKEPEEAQSGITRRQFMIFAGTSLAALVSAGFSRKIFAATDGQASVIRPPAALKEENFVERCIRCGNCIKVCITNGLQPVSWQAGIESIWTPQLVPEIGYCEYHCTLCGNTCPTGAIPRVTLAEKMKARLGVAEIDRSICIPWVQGKDCIVCEEHCPVPEKAIKADRDSMTGALRPSVDEDLCVGCGICQNKCPVRPLRAIRVSPRNSTRS